MMFPGKHSNVPQVPQDDEGCAAPLLCTAGAARVAGQVVLLELLASNE